MKTLTMKAGRALGAALALSIVFVRMPLGFAAQPPPANLTASFSGGTGTYTAGTTVYAKNGGALTLNITAPSNTECVDVSGAFTGHQTSASAKTSWSFTTTAGAGDGVKTANVAAYPNFNANGCNGSSTTGSASYTLDNTGPTLLPSDTNKSGVSPAPNGAGWNKANVSITWTATDAGSGVAGSPSPATDSATANTSGVVKTAQATDNLGNIGQGSVTIKLDKVGPTVSVAYNPARNAFGWNNTATTIGFTCADDLSGIAGCNPGSFTASADGTYGPNVLATDVAGNTNQPAFALWIDKTQPTLTGTPTTSPNAAGWYKANVVVTWSCSDPTVNGASSGIDGSCPASSAISGEGTGLTASASANDRAGNQTDATSPAVKIDKTAPNTTATAPATDWNNVAVTVDLSAFDALSGVKATYYQVDGDAQQAGTSVSINSEGDHTLRYWSEDIAGNVEAPKTIHVKIDQTPPTINHIIAAEISAGGWFRADVTVHYICGDSLSGVQSCGPDQTVTTEGRDQAVSGTAVDNAGNSTTDPATVSIDKTAPTITAAWSPQANDHGWNDSDVTVSFSCADSLSGIDTCPSSVGRGEGAGQNATGTATDAAGNTASATIEGINVDKTPPVLSGDASVPANADGWYAGDVTVHWTCGDALSGVDGPCPADTTITGEGSDLSAGASVYDRAGNLSGATVDGINIDRTAPSTSADVAAPPGSGWYADAVPVTLNTGADLSGVARTHYSVDGGPSLNYTGVFAFDLKGEHTITFWSEDRAGNTEDSSAPGHTVTLKIDGIPPTIDGSRAPAANGFGWNNGPVAVTFVCSDGQSGIEACSGPTTLSTEGGAQGVTGTALDNAGNTSSATVGDINIDLTPPSLSGQPAQPANAAGWYNGDVLVVWTATDDLSGIDGSTLPAEATVTGEGSDLGAGPANVTDRAGNSATASVTGIKIDRTPPTIGGAATTSPNDAGWYRGPVTVHFDCADGLSGLAFCQSDQVLSADGPAQSVAGAASDLADNANAAIVDGIDIDSQAPQTTAALFCTASNGWCRGNTATVVLSAADQPGLSGVKEIHYSVDGGAFQTAAGSTASIDIALPGTGQATVDFYAVDGAGNEELDNQSALRWDNIAPTLTHTVTPPPNAAGWNSADTLVHFDATDDSDGSGVDSVTADQTVADETAGHLIEGTATDKAGNDASDSVLVKLDKTRPIIQGAATTAANANGWYNGPVTVHYTCDDALSGVATCPGDAALTAEGAGQGASGTAVDVAGNSRSGEATGINIDTVAPTTAASAPSALPSGWYAGPVTVSLSADDGLSGVEATYYSVDGGPAQPYAGPITHSLGGTHTITYWSVDRAGNEEQHGQGHELTIRIDNLPPSIDGSRSPNANGFGWNNGPVTVSFDCFDSESGIAGCEDATTLRNEGSGWSVTGHALDNAGNSASGTVGGINIDLTPPALFGEPDLAPNAAGWYRGNVIVRWTASDGLSGIDPGTLPADTTVNGEGSNLSTSAAVSDKAGNTTGVSVTGIRIDRTAPSITGAPTTIPNVAGWYRSAVTVRFSCSDPLSGIAVCANPVLLTDNGAGQTAFGGAADGAGNESSITVGGINIDALPPQTTADNQCTSTNDWCHGSSANVVFTAVDQTGLSGVKEVHYAIDGGPDQVVPGGSASVSVPLSGTGNATLVYYAVDNAGNAEPSNQATLRYDNIAPTVTHSLNPQGNGAGWNNADTTVHFAAVDTAPGSGVDPSTVTPDVTVASETPGQVVNGTATDYSGNIGTDSVSVRLDKTAPTINGAPTTSPNAAGWYRNAVTVHFTCGDALSGIAGSCPSDQTLTANGANQSIGGDVYDRADNRASTTVGGISIDTVAPDVAINGAVDGAIYTLGAVPGASCSAADDLSGLAGPCSGSVAGGAAGGVGTFTYTASATDRAGNATTRSVRYRVVYRWDGFLQPINDTAHQVGTLTSIFKAGSTVPVKFQLKKADGTVVQGASLPTWVVPVKGSPTTAPVDENAYSEPATSGASYRWDSTAQQYIYNWASAKSQIGWYWRIGVILDDGQTYFVNIGLR